MDTNPLAEQVLATPVAEPGFTYTETVGNVVKNIQKSRVVVEMLKRGDFQKNGTITAVLRQRVLIHATYPSISIDNDKQSNPFTIGEFSGAGAGQSHNSRENRVAFIDVPVGTPIATIQAKIATDAQLYRIMSSEPVLTNNHVNAIERGLTSKDEIAKSQVARFPQGDPNAGSIIADKTNNKPVQYRKVFFWNGPKADEDLRGGDAYVSEALQLELNPVAPVATPVEAPVTLQAEVPIAGSQLV